MTIVAVTGHRQLPPDQQLFVESELDRVMEKLAAEVAISGMAPGIDTWWAEIALERGVALHVYVPFPAQADQWPAAAQERYLRLLELATEVVTVAPSYRPSAFQERNQAMVDACDVLVGVWDGRQTGGTWNCIEYARRVGRELVLVDPASRRTVRRTPLV
ncbi:MAG: SLOG family protein [Acidimicrobiales bacterium]